jgi:hypothetical protein
VFNGSAQSCPELIRFDLAKCRLAQALENLRNAQAGGFLYSIVQVDKTPSKLPGQQGANGGFAGAHEAGQAKHLQARL